MRWRLSSRRPWSNGIAPASAYIGAANRKRGAAGQQFRWRCASLSAKTSDDPLVDVLTKVEWPKNRRARGRLRMALLDEHLPELEKLLSSQKLTHKQAAQLFNVSPSGSFSSTRAPVPVGKSVISLRSQRQRQGSSEENRKRHERSGRAEQKCGLGCDPKGLEVRRTLAACVVRSTSSKEEISLVALALSRASFDR
jgi:hypothetical protein